MAEVSRSGYYALVKASSTRARMKQQDRDDFELVLAAYKLHGYSKDDLYGSSSYGSFCAHESEKNLTTYGQVQLVLSIQRTESLQTHGQSLKDKQCCGQPSES